MEYIIKLCVVYTLYFIKYHNQVMMKRYYIGTNENNFLLIEPLLFLVNQKCWTCFNPIGSSFICITELNFLPLSPFISHSLDSFPTS